MWILIILMAAGPDGGVSVDKVEFTSKSACNKALALLPSRLGPTFNREIYQPRIVGICVSEGE